MRPETVAQLQEAFTEAYENDALEGFLRILTDGTALQYPPGAQAAATWIVTLLVSVGFDQEEANGMLEQITGARFVWKDGPT